jgi:hypothetical protein
MADKKISGLTAATAPLAGTEVLSIVQGPTLRSNQFSFVTELGGDDNFIKQAYLRLKTLSEFSDAVNC